MIIPSPNELRRQTANIRCCDHRNRLVEGLEKRRDDATVARFGVIPLGVFHEESRPQAGHRNLERAQRLLQ